ncbi:MAG: manganese-binding transcriptional regulator MntR [Pseudomonadota bacterium]
MPIKPTQDPQERAAAFQRVRDAHQTELAEDYVELIDDLIEINGEARLVDIAEHMGVSRATATQTVKRLSQNGYVAAQRYRSVLLTETGKDLAAKARQRHQILYDFLRAVGIDEVTAFSDAEGMEHHVSGKTLAALKRLTAKLGA